MKNLFTVVIVCLPFFALGQTRSLTNPEVGVSYSGDNQALSVMPYLQQAEQLFKTFDFEEAFFALENAIAENPNSAEALLLRAKLKRNIGMASEAQVDYDMADRLNPYVADLYGYNGPDGLYNLLAITTENALMRKSSISKLNYYHEAIDQYILGSKITPQEADALTYALNALEAEQYNTAKDQLQIILDKNATMPLALDLRGKIYSEEDDDFNAEKLFRKAIEFDPNYSIPWYNLGILELESLNLKKAESHFDKAILIQPNLYKAHFDRAVVRKALGKFDEAIEDYNILIELHGDYYVEAYVNRGLTKKKAGDINGAFNDLNKVILEYPDNAELRKNRGNLYLLYGQREVAIEEYSRAIALDNNYGEAYYNRALAHFKYYDKVSGCQDLERSRDLGYDRAENIQNYFCTF